MNFKKIGTKMLVSIIPVILLAQIVLTVISSVSSNNLVEQQTTEKMESELNYNKAKISGYLDEVKTMATCIAINVADTYTTTEWKQYETMLTEMIATNDMVLGSGLWFEPNVYDSSEKYYGPYVYKDGDSTVTTWDYSNADYDYFSQEYYTNAMSSTEAVITDPYYDETSGTIMSSCSAPIICNGKTIGCVTVDIELTSIEEAVSDVVVGTNGRAMLLTNSGIYLAGVSDEKIQGAENITTDSNSSLAAAGTEILNNEEGTVTYNDGEEQDAYYTTIDGVNWKFLIHIPASELKSPIRTLIMELVVVCIVAIIVAVLIIIKSIGSISKSIQKVQGFAKELADGDFTIETLDVKGKDELAQMSTSLNEMYGNNKDVITSIANHSVSISDASRRLENSASDLRSQFEKIQDLMTNINADMMNSSAATEELTASVDQVSQSTEILDQETKGSLQLAVEIEKRADEIGTSAQEAFDKAQKLRTSYEQKLAESIAQSKVVESIGAMASVISDIADQITLLSLNASIEAARAGEQGKGFAVVATEIGKLAGETAQSVESIQETIVGVQAAFEGLAKNAKVLLEFVTDTVTPDYQNFVGVAEQYGKDAQSITSTSQKLSDMTTSIQQIMAEITDAISNIAESTQSTAGNSAEVMDSVEDVSAIIVEVNDMAESQGEISDDLTNVVRNFKLAAEKAEDV